VVIENGTIRKLWYGFLFAFHSNYASLAVSTQYTNVTDTQLDTAARQQEPRYTASLGCSRAAVILLTYLLTVLRCNLVMMFVTV